MYKFLLHFLLIFSVNLAAQDLYELTAIRFSGNNEFSAAMLKEIIYSKESPGWTLKFINSISSSYGSPPLYFDSTFIETDIICLSNFYKAKGFFKSKITSSYEIDTTNLRAALIYTIEENAPCNYHKLNLKGFVKLPLFLYYQVAEMTNPDTTDRFDQGKIEGNISNVLTFLYNNGYMKAAYDSSVILIDTSVNQVNVDLYFSPGKRYQISDIEIIKKGEGHEYVSNTLIKNVIAISPEEYYDLKKITYSQARLIKTGLFNSLKFSGDDADSSAVRIPLKVEGYIGRMNELSPELLMDNNRNSFNLGLGANYVRKNFFGDARKLLVSGKLGVIDIFHFNYANLFRSVEKRDTTFQGYMELSVKVEQPYVFNRPILGSLEAYVSTRTEYIANFKTYGTKLSFDFELPDFTFINQLKAFYNLELFDLKTMADTINLQFTSTTSSITNEFASINTNDLFFPTKGNNLSFIVEGGISNTSSWVRGSEEDRIILANTLSLEPEDLNESEKAIYYKIQVTLSNFLKLDYLEKSVLAVKTRLGYIQTVYGREDLIPLNKVFAAGGTNSVRGWRARQLVPGDTISYFGQTLSEIRGGTFLLEGSLEYRKKFFNTIGTAVFCDYGNTWNGYKRFRFRELAVAVGFGFRYYSSIAPFRIDFGFQFYDPASNKLIFKTPPFKSMEIHFGIGEAF